MSTASIPLGKLSNYVLGESKDTWKVQVFECEPPLSSFECSTCRYSSSHFICSSPFCVAGDEFALRDGGSLYCKEDHDVMEKSAQSRVAPSIESNNNNNNNNSNLSNNNHSSELGSMSGEF